MAMRASALCGFVLLSLGCAKRGQEWANEPLDAPSSGEECSDTEVKEDGEPSEKSKKDEEKQAQCEEQMEKTKRDISGPEQ